MIDEIQKVLTAYNGLDTVGKRLFRNELGLKRPQQTGRRRRTAAKAKAGTASGGGKTDPSAQAGS